MYSCAASWFAFGKRDGNSAHWRHNYLVYRTEGIQIFQYHLYIAGHSQDLRTPQSFENFLERFESGEQFQSLRFCRSSKTPKLCRGWSMHGAQEGPGTRQSRHFLEYRALIKNLPCLQCQLWPRDTCYHWPLSDEEWGPARQCREIVLQLWMFQMRHVWRKHHSRVNLLRLQRSSAKTVISSPCLTHLTLSFSWKPPASTSFTPILSLPVAKITHDCLRKWDGFSLFC